MATIGKLPFSKQDTGPDGRNWVLRYKDETGQRHAPTFAREEDATVEAERLGLMTRLHLNDIHRFPELADLFEARHKGADMTVRTKMRKLVELGYLRDALGKVELPRIDVARLEETRSLLAERRSPGVVDTLMAQLERMLGEAATMKWIRSNPFAELPPDPLPDVPLWKVLSKSSKRLLMPSLADIGKLASTFESRAASLPLNAAQAGMLVCTVLLTGLRIGEALALTWDAVDYGAEEIHVTSSSSEEGEDENKTKTPSGQRDVPLPSALADLLVIWSRISGAKTGGYVFSYADDVVYARTHALQQAYKWQASVLGERRYHFTAMRHARAALWIWMEVPDDAISLWMGHRHVSFTLDTYGYLFDLADQGAPDWPTGPSAETGTD